MLAIRESDRVDGKVGLFVALNCCLTSLLVFDLDIGKCNV